MKINRILSFIVILLLVAAGLFISVRGGFRADIIYVEKIRYDQLGIYEYDIARDKIRLREAVLGDVLDIIKKDGTWYRIIDNVMIYEKGKEVRTSTLPISCRPTVDNSKREVYTSSFCQTGFKDGKLFVRHTFQRVDLTFTSEYSATEDYTITRVDYIWDGKEFVRGEEKTEVLKNPFVEEFAFRNADFLNTMDTDYWSLNRKMSEVGWDYRYDGKHAYMGWLSSGDGNAWASGDNIRVVGNDIEITTKMFLINGRDEKEMRFRLKDFLRTEKTTNSYPYDDKEYSKTYMIFEAAGGKYYVMANTEFGDTPHIMDYFYILRPNSDKWAKIEPPRGVTGQLGTIEFSKDYILVSSNGQWHLYNLDGRLLKVWEEGIGKMAFMP